MNLTAKEIIPDMKLTSYADAGVNLHGARNLLDRFLRIFSRTGEVNRDCLFEILQMDLDEARAFLKYDSSETDDGVSPNPVACDQAGQMLAALQMMLHEYLSGQMVPAA